MTSKKQPPLLSMPSLQDAAELLRVLGHPTRLRILEMLLRGRYCVGELAEACDVPSHVASEHRHNTPINEPAPEFDVKSETLEEQLAHTRSADQT